MSTPARPKIILGGGLFGSPRVSTVADVKAQADLFRSFGHNTIDSARSYPVENPSECERLLAEAGVSSWATIDTKTETMGDKPHSRERLLSSIEASLNAFGFKEGGSGKEQVDVMYLHMPCPDVPFEETMRGMNEAYQRGMFRRLGVSNYSPEQVEELVKITKENGETYISRSAE